MRLIPSFLALAIAMTPAFAGGGTVTSTEPGPPSLTEEATGQMLETLGIEPATARTTEAVAVTYVPPPQAPVSYAAPPKAPSPVTYAAPPPPPQQVAEVEVAEAKVAEAPTGPLVPREEIHQCTTCHGVDGIARIPTAPNIAGSSRQYLETQLKAFRSGKRENEVMSVIAEDLSNAQIKAVAKWYAGLKVTVEVPE